MSQKKGLHSLLEIPFIYNAVQRIFAHKTTQIEWENLIAVEKLGVVLDVGCGPGNKSENFISSEKYIGIDISEIYISEAKTKYGDIGDFFVLSVLDIEKLSPQKFDLVILNGVLHHLSDYEVDTFFESISKRLNKKGAIVTVDPTFRVGRLFANFFVSLDRGMNVRHQSELVKLVEKHFSIKEKMVIEQTLPPYQRVLLKFGAQGAV